MAKSVLPNSKLARFGLHTLLLILSYYCFIYSHQLCGSLDFDPYLAFMGAGVVTGTLNYLLCGVLLKDEKMSDGILRDVGLIWLYLFLFAPLLSVSLLPDLPINKDSFSTIGIEIQKGMVTNAQLASIHKTLWIESGRSSWLPWEIAELTNFKPTLRISVPRSELEHSTRHLTKTSRGNTKVEYDLLLAKFWLPEGSSVPTTEEVATDDTDTADTDAKTPDADESKETEADDDDETETKDSKSTEDEAAKEVDETETETATKADDTADPVEEEELDLRSYVTMVVRASPRLNLYPHPKRKGKKAQARVMGEHQDICGKVFNGIPRGEAVDEAATKLDRDLPKDPNSLAFSFRADECGWCV